MFAPFLPAGLLMFGIGLNNGAPWPVLAVGLGLVGVGTTPASSISLTYLTDSYTLVRAKALLLYNISFFWEALRITNYILNSDCCRRRGGCYLCPKRHFYDICLCTFSVDCIYRDHRILYLVCSNCYYYLTCPLDLYLLWQKIQDSLCRTIPKVCREGDGCPGAAFCMISQPL